MIGGPVSAGALLAPALVLVAMTFALLVWGGRMRFSAVGRGEVKMRDIALREPNWPKRILQIGNCFQNQLELPVLFYVLVAFLLVTGEGDLVDLVLAWAFVAARIAHAAVFVTSNDVRKRGPIFVLGMGVLIAHWAWFAVGLYAF
ncbi:MAPEG family protein [Salinarimonas rosea]|uniref:MAPEG family protein n=1 Tax=Salinarimonas rosea TaxID=552063 RepID=UPI000413FD7B|nr:MAPEG family protein [Salinarimonas rosea]